MALYISTSGRKIEFVMVVDFCIMLAFGISLINLAEAMIRCFPHRLMGNAD